MQGETTGSESEKWSGKKVIRLSHSHPASYSSELHLTAWVFKNYIESQSENIEVRIYPGNALGQEREVYEAIQLGSGANCIISGTAILNNFIPEFSVLDLPYLWKDYDHVHEALDGRAGELLEQYAEPYGFKVLAWLDSWGYRHIVLGREISSIDDLTGTENKNDPIKYIYRVHQCHGHECNPHGVWRSLFRHADRDP